MIPNRTLLRASFNEKSIVAAALIERRKMHKEARKVAKFKKHPLAKGKLLKLSVVRSRKYASLTSHDTVQLIRDYRFTVSQNNY